MNREDAVHKLALVDRQGRLVAGQDRGWHRLGTTAGSSEAGGIPKDQTNPGLLFDPQDPAVAIPLHGRIYRGSSVVQDGVVRFQLAVPVGLRIDEPLAVLIATMDASRLWQEIEVELHRPGISIYLVDSRGNLLVPPIDSELRAGELITHVDIVRSLIAQRSWDSTDTYTGLNGSACFGTATLLDSLNWGVISEIRESTITQPITTILVTIAVIAAVVMIASAVLGLVLMNRMLRPMTSLSEAFDRVARGDYSQPIPSSRVKEFNTLSTGFNRMMSERQQAEEEATRFSRVLEMSLNEIYLFDAETLHFIEVNRGARENLGYTKEELRSLTALDLKPEFTHEKFMELVEPLRTGDRNLIQFHTIHRRKDGSHYPVEVYLQLVSGDPPVFAAIILDVTERKRTEEAARRAQDELLAHRERQKELVEAELAKVRDELVRKARLATIGQLAASIAHEIRTPLGTVRNAAYYLKRHVPKDNPKLPEYLDIIDHEVTAADRVIRDMMEMARSKEPVKTSVDLGPMLRDTLERIRPGAAIGIQISLEPDPFLMQADPSQLQQVLSNILLNATQAIEDEGEIVVVARRNNDYDTITVQDSGPGVAAQDREQVFEPLFTTRAKGTGLGLAICQQIIERHGGSVDLLDGDGPGATFSIRLPRQDAPAATETTRKEYTAHDTIRHG